MDIAKALEFIDKGYSVLGVKQNTGLDSIQTRTLMSDYDRAKSNLELIWAGKVVVEPAEYENDLLIKEEVCNNVPETDSDARGQFEQYYEDSAFTENGVAILNHLLGD